MTRDPQGRIHFCEVKAWRPGPVHPLESLSRRRRARMVATARIFLEDLENRETGEQADISFDLLWVQPASGAVEHFEAIVSSDDDASIWSPPALNSPGPHANISCDRLDAKLAGRYVAPRSRIANKFYAPVVPRG